jgi:hypothetical protein
LKAELRYFFLSFIQYYKLQRLRLMFQILYFSKAFKACRKSMDKVWGVGLTIEFSSLTFLGKHKFSHDAKAESNIRSPKSKVLSVGFISVIKKCALRRGIWFRALSRVERGVLDLTTRYVDCIRSTQLAKVVTAILEKLKLATESVVDRLVRTVGFSLAQKISVVAVGLGNRSAILWAVDGEFARYLAVAHLNSSRI